MAATTVIDDLADMMGELTTAQLPDSGVVAGSYTSADITVDDKGRITVAANGTGGSGAPNDATYIVQTPSAGLSAEQALSALSTGLLKVTTTTGVLSTAAAGTDYLEPAGSGASLTGVVHLAGAEEIADAKTFTSPLTINNQLNVGVDASTTTALSFNGAAGNPRDFQFQTASVNRWIVRANGTAEGGANAGSDFMIVRRADNGSDLGAALEITRSSGLVTIGSASISQAGVYTGSGASLTGVVHTIGTESVDGTKTFLGSVRYGDGTAAVATIFNGATATTRDFQFQTSGSVRWIIRVDGTAESGANAGSDFAITSRTDAGGGLHTILSATRSTGTVTVAGASITQAGAITGTGAGITGLSGSNITTGTVAVAQGGTGVGTLTGLAKGNGTAAFTAAVAGTDYLAPSAIGVTVLSQSDNLDDIALINPTKGRLIVGEGVWNHLTVGLDGYVLTADSAETSGLKWAAAGGGGSPGGSTGQVQYNDASAFGGASKLTIGSNGNPLLTAQTTPGTLADGELFQGTQKTLAAYVNGITHRYVGTLFTKTDDTTVVNSTTVTDMTGSGIGSMTLPANFLVPGKRLRLVASGLWSSDASPGNFSFQMRFNGSGFGLAAIGANAIASMTNKGWTCECHITCRTAGVSGTVMAIFWHERWATTASYGRYEATMTSPNTVDTTASIVVSLNGYWVLAKALNSITCQQMTFEALN